jgi:hypothetical protein
MRRRREIPFAFTETAYAAAVNDVNNSKQNKRGTVIDIYQGNAGGYPIGIILIEEDI